MLTLLFLFFYLLCTSISSLPFNFLSFLYFILFSLISPFLSYLSFILPRVRVLRLCLFPLAGFDFYFLVSFPFYFSLYLLIPSVHFSLFFFLMTNQDFWEYIPVYGTPGVHKSRALTRRGDCILHGSS